MKTEAIVASAGQGKRLRSGIRKPYLKIKNIPILAFTLKALAASKEINSLIVVVDGRDIGKCRTLVKKYGIKKVKAVIKGGGRRPVSVRNGLKALDTDTDIVLIHDGVRPFIDTDVIDASIRVAKRFGACIVGVPVKATIKTVASCQLPVASKRFVVEKTLDRKKLWEIQTPQVFKKALILAAYKKFGNIEATDDAMLVEKMGKKVQIITGSYKNIKITTPEDLVIARALLECV
ncbi:MAG: 2-C-methyl-D-erythritol 4-phosphate cytidylyltransferase [Candidatus Omnitrophica bacterium]|nr:2-C-methyl-D-erythritol 4-phosphate cytidylyltransferase [Candidatus Omnitrophota bacterium]